MFWDTLFASILNLSVMRGNYLPQTTSADDIFRCVFSLGALRVNMSMVYNSFFCFSGKQRHIKLLHQSALEGYDVDPVKIQETKGCHLFSTNSGQKFSNSYLCVAIKRTIQAFELTKSRQKHRKIRDFTVPGQVQFMELLCDKLFVGYQSCFAIYSVQGDTAPMSKLHLFLLLHVSQYKPSILSMVQRHATKTHTRLEQIFFK